MGSRGGLESSEHCLETDIVGINERVVEDQRTGLTRIRQQLTERQSCQDCNLLLGAITERR